MFQLILVCMAGFLGAFVDAIVGGGGLVTIPALLATGMPIHLALGTNKFASSFGTMSSAYNFARSGNVDFKLLKFLIPLSFIGSFIGVNTVLMLDPQFLSVLIIFMVLAIVIYTVVKRDLGLEENFKGMAFETVAKGMLLALILGFYDGFFGPGTGSFLIFGLIHIFGYDFKKASANSKLLNFTSNITAFILFMVNGQILYGVAIPMAICMMIGGRVGSQMAISKGSKFIKPLFVVVSLSLVVKMVFDMV